MDTSLVFIVISIVVLAVVAIFVFFTGRNRDKNRLNPLASLAYAFVLAGIIFGDDRFFGYGLMGAGVILAIIDIIIRSRSN